jgi:acetyl esterase
MLKDEGTALGNKLREAGVEVEHFHFEGLIHGSLNFTKVIPRGKEICECLANGLKKAFYGQ